MCTSRTKANEGTYFEIGNYSFERVPYLPEITDEENKIGEEIRIRLEKGNRVYFTYKRLLSSKILSHKSKICT